MHFKLKRKNKHNNAEIRTNITNPEQPRELDVYLTYHKKHCPVVPKW